MSYKLSKDDDGIIYVTLENGKRYRLDYTLEHHAHIRAVDEVRDDTTLRREWWRRRVVSRDLPNSKAARADYGDGGAGVRNIVDAIDWKPEKAKPFPCVIAKRNCCRIARRLMINNWHRVGNFVAAVWKNGNEGREETMAAFGLSDRAYRRRCELYAAILGYGNGLNLHTSGSC